MLLALKYVYNISSYDFDTDSPSSPESSTTQYLTISLISSTPSTPLYNVFNNFSFFMCTADPYINDYNESICLISTYIFVDLCTCMLMIARFVHRPPSRVESTGWPVVSSISPIKESKFANAPLVKHSGSTAVVMRWESSIEWIPFPPVRSVFASNCFASQFRLINRNGC